MHIFDFLYNLLMILVAGLIAGIISKKLRIPMVIGYLVVGAFIGMGGVQGIFLKIAKQEEIEAFIENKGINPYAIQQFLSLEHSPDPEVLDYIESEVLEPPTPPQETSEPEKKQSTVEEALSSREFRTEVIDELAELGALFLLFSIGIQFAPSQLVRMKKFLLLGGPLQMMGVILPIVGFSYFVFHDWRIGFLVGCAVSLSSTVLVFKSLEEYGQANSPLGLRAVAILLFQDVAIAPILLLLPIVLAGPGTTGVAKEILFLIVKSIFFVSVAVTIRFLFIRFGVHLLQQKMKSVELIVLFTVVLLFGICLFAGRLGLPAAVGAFATGVVLSETRLTRQIAAITVPFRETFSAIFFVSLGALLDLRILFDHPVSTLGLFGGLILLKMGAGAIAFRCLGITNVSSAALGLGIAQLGELSFVILQQGTFRVNNPELYQQMLFVALLSLILTPLFLKIAIYYIRNHGSEAENKPVTPSTIAPVVPLTNKKCALVIGLGPIGHRMVLYLQNAGMAVRVLDMNPINVQPYTQEGLWTASGDAAEPSTLKKLGMDSVQLVVVTIPNDDFAPTVVESVRKMNPNCTIVVRCRYTGTVKELKKNGADQVVCEESSAGNALTSILQLYV